ncbi:MAG TPA: chromate transporter [Streptosporangiaceae bacterium]
MSRRPAAVRVPLSVIIREWGRIGCIGFGGPPAHITLLRKLCVQDRRWLAESEFEDGIAAVNLLPGPASTQLAIYCAWRLRGAAGALVGGACFIVPGLALILGLAAVFLASRPPNWIEGAALGAGAAVPAVAVAAAVGLIPASWRRASEGAPRRAAEGGPGPGRGVAGAAGPGGGEAGAAGAGGADAGPVGPGGGVPRRGRERSLARARWGGYLVAGGVAAAAVGPWLVLVLAACGLIEVGFRQRPRGGSGRPAGRAVVMLPFAAAVPVMGGLGALAWVAVKVGALSYGGGFVIIPLMQHDAVRAYHWLTAAQFLTAVALGQVTPGPVVQTVAVVGFAAAGVGGGLLAALIAFAPSFGFVLAGGPSFGRLRHNAGVQAFLTGAGPAAIGAIAGAAIPLGASLAHLWQVGVLGAAVGWLIGLRRGVVTGIVGAAVAGVIVAIAGGPVT